MNDDAYADALAALTASHDQLGASANGLASTIASYMNTLIASGLERHEALTLTDTYQHILLHSIFNTPVCDD